MRETEYWTFESAYQTFPSSITEVGSCSLVPDFRGTDGFQLCYLPLVELHFPLVLIQNCAPLQHNIISKQPYGLYFMAQGTSSRLLP